MDLVEVRRHIQIQAYNLEHFITYDPKKTFKEQSNHNKIKRKTVYDEPTDIEESDQVDESFKETKKKVLNHDYENKNNISYDLNVEKDLYGIDNESDPEIKVLMKEIPKELTIIEKPKILSEKEQYFHDIEIARNSKKRKRLTSVIYE